MLVGFNQSIRLTFLKLIVRSLWPEYSKWRCTGGMQILAITNGLRDLFMLVDKLMPRGQISASVVVSP